MTWWSGKVAVTNPWGGRTLEWTIPSPPPLENFVQPVLVSSGPYDYGVAGPRVMGTPVIAGGAVDAAGAAGVEMPHIDTPGHARAVRIAVWLMIVSDAVFVLAFYAAFIYLHGLNTQGAFKPSTESRPSVVGSLLVAAASVVAASAYAWGQKGLRSGDSGRLRTGVMLAVVISMVALIGDLVVFANLNYPPPLHAYGSFMSLFILYHAVRHLVVGVLIGALVLGRLYSGRLAGRDYVIQATGYWFWWVAITGVTTLVLIIAIS
jgi:heme/copper-type cytochrome/quinol oxidase subunit 3